MSLPIGEILIALASMSFCIAVRDVNQFLTDIPEKVRGDGTFNRALIQEPRRQ
jgi:hypothetical protein